MTRDKIPIDATHASNVEAQLDRLHEAGPAPRMTWTRQSLVERVSAKVLAMRADGFSLDEIAEGMTYNGLRFSPEMLSSYLSRLKHGAAGNGVASEARHKNASKRSKPSTGPATTRKRSPRQDTKQKTSESRSDIVEPVASDPTTATIPIGRNPVFSDANDQTPGPLTSGGARTTKPGKGWLEKHS